MARKSNPSATPTADLTLNDMRAAIPQLQRRIGELKTLDIAAAGHDLDDLASKLRRKINATLVDIFGFGTVEYNSYAIDTLSTEPLVMGGGPTPLHENQRYHREGIQRATHKLEGLLEFFQEKVADGEGPGPGRVIAAYQGLQLHPEIARAANDRYLGGFYADAVEAAVKALNALVRLRSGAELDGTQLMQKVFSANGPMLRFNDLKDQSDKDEQQGFMWLFSGAVMGLRNPRAHGFVNDDPERALEFIAFVSLLAKLLDGAKR